MRKQLAALFAAALIIVQINAAQANGPRIGSSEVISRAAPGLIAATGGSESQVDAVSADGRWVALTSGAANLVPGQRDESRSSDVFLYDRFTGMKILVSHADGLPATAADGESYSGVLNADGRFLAYSSTANHLIPHPSGLNIQSVFLYDRVAGTTTLINHKAGSPGTFSGFPAGSPSVSADGRYVTYQSAAADLVAGQTGTSLGANIFLWDRTTGVTTLVSHAAGALEVVADAPSEAGALSADGRFVLFQSAATNLVEGQAGPLETSNVFLYDRVGGTTSLVSHTAISPTTTGNLSSSSGSIAADGRFVAYLSRAADLVPGQIDPHGQNDLFLWNRLDGSTTLVSHAAGAPTTAATGEVEHAFLSADGNTLGFDSAATNLVPGPPDPLGQTDVFLYDRASGTTRRVTAEADPQAQTHLLGITADGRFLLLLSGLTDLVPGQVNAFDGSADLFLYDQTRGTFSLVSHTAGSPAGAGHQVIRGFLSSNGSAAAFFSPDTDLVAGLTDTNGANDAFVWERTTQEISVASRRALGLPSATGGGHSTEPLVSADGRWVVFVSEAPNLVRGQEEPWPFSPGRDVFLRNRLTGETRLVSHAQGHPTRAADQLSLAPTISRNGRFVAFQSYASNLVAGQEDPIVTSDVFLYDRDTEAVTLVSHTTAGSAVAGGGAAPVLSDEGDVVAFVSQGASLVPGQINPFPSDNVFVFEKSSGSLTLVSHVAGAPSTTGFFCDQPAVSASGRFITFSCFGDALVPGDYNSFSDVFLFDRATGGNTLVSHSAGEGFSANGSSESPSLSADGRFVAFESDAVDLASVDAPYGSPKNVYLYDRETDRMTLVSHAAGAPTSLGAGVSIAPVISRDGDFVAFSSSSTNLVPGQTGGQRLNAFLWDRAKDKAVLVSRPAGSPATGTSGVLPGIAVSAKGRWVAFSSLAADLVPGDDNQSLDVFLFDRISGKVSLIDHLPGAPGAVPFEGGGGITPLSLSADGKCVAYVSISPDLAAGDFNARQDVFLACRGESDD